MTTIKNVETVLEGVEILSEQTAWLVLGNGYAVRDSIGRDFRIIGSKLQQLIGGKTWQPVTEIGTGPWDPLIQKTEAPEEKPTPAWFEVNNINELQGACSAKILYPDWVRPAGENLIRTFGQWNLKDLKTIQTALAAGAEVRGYYA